MTSIPDTATQPRSAVPKTRTWDSESVFATVADWEAALEALVADLPKLEALSGRLAEGAQVTIEALAARDELIRRLGHVFVYAYLDYAVETTAQEAVARFGKAQTVYGRVLATVAFIEPELLTLGRDRLDEWSDESPALAPYAHYLDDLFRRGEHVRSAEVEELLGQLADPHQGPYAVYSGLVDSDLTFEPATGGSGETAEVSQGSVEGLLASPDRMLRRSAWESYADGYRAVRNALTANYTTAIKMDVFSGMARRHESTRAASLSASNIPLEVFDNLLATFEQHLPTWHRYWKVRAELIGVDRLQPFDLWAPLGGPGAAHLRAVRRVDLRVARAARLRVRRDGTPRLPGGALDRRLPEPGQDGRRVLGGLAGDASLHRHELRRHGLQSRHARTRAGSLHALVSHVEDAAANLLALLDVRRRGRVELPSGAVARPPSGRGLGPRPQARDPR